MSLSTKNVTVSTGGTNKMIQPGNIKATILSIELVTPGFAKPGESTSIVLELLEDAPEGFEGFPVDRNNPSKGVYPGPVGKVRSSRYFYQDSKTKGGIEIKRVDSMLRFLKSLCMAADQVKWFEDQDGIESIEALFEKAESDKIFKDKWFHFCIGAKKYTNAKGYPANDLFIAANSKAGYSIVSEENADKVLPFNAAEHIIDPGGARVNSFKPAEDDNLLGGSLEEDFGTASDSFDLDD